LRRENKLFSRGNIELIKPENRKIFAFTRSYEGETALCVFNLSHYAQPVELDLAKFEGAIPVEMMGGTPFPKIGRRPYQLALASRNFYWFLLSEEA
jgi:maltose alpha-D-glucosyltransferase/alpha-amylase